MTQTLRVESELGSGQCNRKDLSRARRGRARHSVRTAPATSGCMISLAAPSRPAAGAASPASARGNAGAPPDLARICSAGFQTRVPWPFQPAFEWLMLALFVLALSAPARAGFALPSDRCVDWTQAGVAGGIPSVSIIYTNLVAIDHTGATDVSAAINAALSACPSNQVVQLPAGVFLLSNPLTMSDGVVLRGQGSNTVILGNLNGPMVLFYGPFWYYDRASVASGFSQGSSNLVLPTLPADLGVGSKVQITESNDASLVNPCGSDGCVGEYAVGQWVEVQAIHGTTLTVWPPLYWNYTNTLSPFIHFPVNGSSVSHNFVEHAGVEELTLCNQNPGLEEVNIAMYFAANCWIKHVRSYWGSICHLWTYDTYRCEIRDSLFSGVTPPITSSRCYGLQTGTPNSPNPSSKTTALLVENNIWTGCRGSIVLGYGAAGCVCDYNYFADALNEVPTVLRADLFVHSAHPVMNLFEGNAGGAFNADDFHGSSSDNTLFRNYWRGRDLANVTVSSLRSVEVDAWSRRYNVVGNVLGSTNVNEASMTALANPAGGALALAVVPDTTWSYQNWYKAQMWGYDSESGGTSLMDTNAYLSALITGNYNYVENQTDWDTNGTQTLPVSLCHPSAQPVWWTNWGLAAWPPIGPDLSPMISLLPAQLRYTAILNGTEPQVAGAGLNSITQIIVGRPTTLTANGIPGNSYITERATNLLHPLWVNISTNLAATNGLITILDDFNDLGGTPPAASFYRLQWQP